MSAQTLKSACQLSGGHRRSSFLGNVQLYRQQPTARRREAFSGERPRLQRPRRRTRVFGEQLSVQRGVASRPLQELRRLGQRRLGMDSY